MYPSNVTQTETRTGADGSFSLKGLAPDQYQLIFEGSGFTRAAKTDITVTEGANTPIGELRMERGGTLSGTIYDATGKGVVGAGIMLVSADAGTTPRMYQTKSGADGKYTLRHVAQGRYKARPTPAAGANGNPLEDMRIGGDAERSITIADAQESQIELTLPASAPPAAQPLPDEQPPTKLAPGGGARTQKPH